MASVFLWPSEDGWPYPDDAAELVDHELEIDDDLLSLRYPPHDLLANLAPLERLVVGARFGLGGVPVRSMKQLHLDTGRARSELRDALGSGLSKLRVELS